VGGVEVIRTARRAADFGGAPVSGARAEQELGWAPTTPLREGVRRYLEWHRAELQPARPEWRPALATLLRRAAVAALVAAVVASGVLALGLLVPTGDELDHFDTFAAMLALLAPVMLATGFEWDGERERFLRAACWTWVGVALLALLSPWPPQLDWLGHAHPYFLSLMALSGGAAALGIGSAPWLSTLLPAAGDR